MHSARQLVHNLGAPRAARSCSSASRGAHQSSRRWRRRWGRRHRWTPSRRAQRQGRGGRSAAFPSRSRLGRRMVRHLLHTHRTGCPRLGRRSGCHQASRTSCCRTWAPCPSGCRLGSRPGCPRCRCLDPSQVSQRQPARWVAPRCPRALCRRLACPHPRGQGARTAEALWCWARCWRVLLDPGALRCLGLRSSPLRSAAAASRGWHQAGRSRAAALSPSTAGTRPLPWYHSGQEPGAPRSRRRSRRSRILQQWRPCRGSSQRAGR